ncbi:hypothetical protein QAD02_005610 [Eretmocerus hayati]|uniref:Uncharacterized protein n=1 Tax=Eretmocerus hayati TaxID=131215 RepID=A0ACC2NT05_9HYME|nr:hypothetical protein QAD02_005610 [Eretmocerus hayati]
MVQLSLGCLEASHFGDAERHLITGLKSLCECRRLRGYMTKCNNRSPSPTIIVIDGDDNDSATVMIEQKPLQTLQEQHEVVEKENQDPKTKDEPQSKQDLESQVEEDPSFNRPPKFGDVVWAYQPGTPDTIHLHKVLGLDPQGEAILEKIMAPYAPTHVCSVEDLAFFGNRKAAKILGTLGPMAMTVASLEGQLYQSTIAMKRNR